MVIPGKTWKYIGKRRDTWIHGETWEYLRNTWGILGIPGLGDLDHADVILGLPTDSGVKKRCRTEEGDHGVSMAIEFDNRKTSATEGFSIVYFRLRLKHK